MKRIIAAVECDNCTKSEDFESEDQELEDGWLILSRGTEMYDFCDHACLGEWINREVA